MVGGRTVTFLKLIDAEKLKYMYAEKAQKHIDKRKCIKA